MYHPKKAINKVLSHETSAQLTPARRQTYANQSTLPVVERNQSPLTKPQAVSLNGLNIRYVLGTGSAPRQRIG